MTFRQGKTSLFRSSQQLLYWKSMGSSSQQLHNLCLGTLEGLFELTQRPTRALNLNAYVASELQRNKDTVRCGALGEEVPGHRTEQLTQTFIVRLLKTHFFTPILDCKKSTE